jgi:hypothetical protein
MSFKIDNTAPVARLTLTMEHLEANPAEGRRELLVQLARRWSDARPRSMLSFQEFDQHGVGGAASLGERLAAYDEQLQRYQHRLLELRAQADEIADLAASEGIDDSILAILPDRAAALVCECEKRIADWEVEKQRLLREQEAPHLDLSDVIAQARNLLTASR